MLVFAGFCLVLAVGFAKSAAALQSGQGRELHEIYDIAPNGAVTVMNTSGQVRVTSWTENRVRIDAVKVGGRDEEIDLVEIQIVTKPDRIEIRTIYPRGRSTRVSVNYELRVPRTVVLDGLATSSGDIIFEGPVARLTARSSSGNIDARAVSGDAVLSSTSGRIIAGSIGGALSITSTSGDQTVAEVASTLSARCTSCAIKASGIGDDATAQATSGNIEIVKAGGRVTARATSGWVKIRDVGGDVIAESFSDSVTATDVRGRVTANALSGNILVRGVGEGARLTAISGNVEIDDARGRIEINATSGSIALTNADGRDVSVKSVSGGIRFTGRIYDDGRYEFVTFSGNVVLHLPPDSNFNLSANSQSGSVNTEFPLQLKQGTQFGGRAPVIGVAGKGGAELRTITHSGSIQIRKISGQTR